jgi:hypothetical protein
LEITGSPGDGGTCQKAFLPGSVFAAGRPRFEEVRAHLGVETQRQWSDKAIDRTTPVLLGLFSFVTLLADKLQKQGKLQIATSAWYKKAKPTFSDALAAVRRLLWQKMNFSTSDNQHDMIKIPKPLLNHFQHILAHAA